MTHSSKRAARGGAGANSSHGGEDTGEDTGEDMGEDTGEDTGVDMGVLTSICSVDKGARCLCREASGLAALALLGACQSPASS